MHFSLFYCEIKICAISIIYSEPTTYWSRPPPKSILTSGGAPSNENVAKIAGVDSNSAKRGGSEADPSILRICGRSTRCSCEIKAGNVEDSMVCNIQIIVISYSYLHKKELIHSKSHYSDKFWCYSPQEHSQVHICRKQYYQQWCL